MLCENLHFFFCCGYAFLEGAIFQNRQQTVLGVVIDTGRVRDVLQRKRLRTNDRD
jgi:hypothetical protein